MTTPIQAVFLGIMLALTPSIIVLAFLLWREGIGIAEEKKARSRDLYFSRDSTAQAPVISCLVNEINARDQSAMMQP
jgi:hypothetical protein